MFNKHVNEIKHAIKSDIILFQMYMSCIGILVSMLLILIERA
jgi:hypothetical protein